MHCLHFLGLSWQPLQHSIPCTRHRFHAATQKTQGGWKNWTVFQCIGNYSSQLYPRAVAEKQLSCSQATTWTQQCGKQYLVSITKPCAPTETSCTTSKGPVRAPWSPSRVATQFLMYPFPMPSLLAKSPLEGGCTLIIYDGTGWAKGQEHAPKHCKLFFWAFLQVRSPCLYVEIIN